MSQLSARELSALAQQAGYQVVSVEQLRANRWLVSLLTPQSELIVALYQARPLVGASDVLDMAELVRLRRARRAYLIAYGGAFSPAAFRTLNELRGIAIELVESLPAASTPTPTEPERGPAGG